MSDKKTPDEAVKAESPKPKQDPKVVETLIQRMSTERMAEKKDLTVQKKKTRIVALVGSASSTLGQTPWDDKSIEMWTLGWRKVPRSDRLFDMHPLGQHRKNVPPNYEQLVDSLNIPFYTTHPVPDVRKNVVYPFKEIQEFNRSIDPYWTDAYYACSVAYMVNLAIYEGVDEIQFYGLDFVADGEYSHQRPCMEYYIGIARGRGIRVYMPKDCAMCEFPYVYGYESKSGVGYVDKEMLNARIKEYKQRHQDSLAMAYVADGALQEAQQLLELIKHQERGGSIRQLKEQLKNMKLEKETK